MSDAADKVMSLLYSGSVWDGFEPIAPPAAEVQGWNGNHPSLTRLVSSPGRKIVVDVGVWKGQSTIAMAKAMQQHQIDGCVVAVDTFLGSIEHWGLSELFKRRHSRPDIFDQFMTNVIAAGVQDYVVPLPQTSITAAAILLSRGVMASIVHVDAAHEYEEVLRDAKEYWKIIESGGHMIGDDYASTFPGVIRAAGEFSASTNLPLEIEYPKWIVRKP